MVEKMKMLVLNFYLPIIFNNLILIKLTEKVSIHQYMQFADQKKIK